MSVDIADLAIRIDTQELRLAQLELDRLRGSAGNAERAAGSLGVGFRALGSALAAVGLAEIGHELVGTIEQVQNMDVRLQGLTKTAKDFAQVEKYLSELSQKHHKDNLVLADGMSRLLTLEQAGLIVRKQSTAILQGMSNAQSKTGASMEQLKQSMFGFAQGMAAGIVYSEEFNQVTEPIPGLLNKMADASGYTAGELRKLVKDGRITSEVFGKIMVEALNSYEGAAEAAGDTLTAKYGDIRNAWIELVRVLEAPISNILTPLLEAVAKSIDGIAHPVQGLIKDLRELQKLLGMEEWTGSSNMDWQGSSGTMKKDDTEKAARVAALHAEIEANKGLSKAKSTAASESEKAAKRAIDDARRKAEAIADGIRAEFAALDDQHNKLTLSERDYYASTLALKHMSFAQKAMALAVWDSNKALQDQSDKQSTAERELATLTDRYNQLTLSAREYYQTKLQGEGLSTEQQTPLMDKFDQIAAAESNKQAIDEADQSLKTYLSSLDSANAKTSDLGAVTSSVFDGALGGINTMAGAFDALVTAIDTATKSLEQNSAAKKLNDAKADGPDKASNALAIAKQEIKLNDDLVKAKVSGTRQIAGAVSSMLKQGTTEQRAAHAIEMGLAGIELAMNLQKIFGIGAVAAAETASVAPSVAASTSKGMAKAAEAVATQASAGPYIGFALMAAMAVAMAAIGFGVGGGSSKSVPRPTGSPDTGSVLGDSTAQSESIDKTYQLLEDIHAQEYAELREINKGITAMSKGITDVITRLFQAGGIVDPSMQLGTKSNMPAFVNPQFNVDPITKFILGGIFGKTTKSIVGGGIATGSAAISDLLNGGQIQGNQYTTVETKKKSWFSSSTKFSEVTSELDSATEDALTKVFQSMGKTMLGLADALGGGINQRVKDYIIPSLKVELRGLSGEEAAKKLNGVISTALDNMAANVFGDIIGQYQQLGEGMLETAVRIVAEVAVVRDALDASGLGLGADAIAISDALAQAAGGLQEFQKQFDAYYDKFYSESEKQSRLYDKLTSQLGDLNLTLPQTREGYRKLIESLNISNQADQERYSLLLNLAGAADQYYTAITDGSEKASNLAKQQRALDIALMEAQGNALGALAEKRKDELAAMDESLRLTQKAIWAFQDLTKAQQEGAQAAAKAVSDAMAVLNKAVATEKKRLSDAYNADVKVSQAAIERLSQSVSKLSNVASMLRNVSDAQSIAGNEAAERRHAQEQIIEAIKSGNLDERVLNKALTVVSKPSENLYKNFNDYQRDFITTAHNISTLSTIADSQLVKEETALDVAKAQLETLKVAYDAELAGLDNILAAAQAQIDAANGTTIATRSVQMAVIGVQAAINGQKAQAAKAAADLQKLMVATAAAAEADRQARASAAAEAKAAADKAAAEAKAAAAARAAAEAAAAAARAKAEAQARAATLAGYRANTPTTYVNGQTNNPYWEKVLSDFNTRHTAQFGIAMNRDWTADQDAQAEYQRLKAAYLASIPAFASGGMHRGGLAIVGEHGPELVNMPAGRVFNHNESKAMMNNDDLILEIRALRAEVSMLRASSDATAQSTRKTSDLLRNVTQDGNSLLTTAA